MFKLMERSTETCIGIKVEGKLKANDYDALQPILNNAIKAHGAITLVLEIEEFEGYKDLDAILADVEMSFDKSDSIEKVAVVSDSDWQKFAAKLLDPLAGKTDLEFFETDRRDEAWIWALGE